MSKQFWGFFGVAIAVVAIVVSLTWFGNVKNHLVLKCTVLTVRTLDITNGDKEHPASLLVVDFRIKNPTDVPFVSTNVDVTVETQSGEILKSFTVSKPDVNMEFQYHPTLGPKLNEVLSMQDKVAPRETVDRMVAARFEVPATALDARKAVHIHIEDVDGTPIDFSDPPVEKP